MAYFQRNYSLWIWMMLLVVLGRPGAILGEGPPQGVGGWERDGVYNKLYRASELDKIKGELLDIIEVTPFPGMSPGVALLLRDEDGEAVEIHLGPQWFIKPEAIGVKKGEILKIKGAWAEIQGKDVFLAAKVKKGEYFSYKVRLTKDGTPFWTMSPEELAKERVSEP